MYCQIQGDYLFNEPLKQLYNTIIPAFKMSSMWNIINAPSSLWHDEVEIS